jgi:hypothetical protein
VAQLQSCHPLAKPSAKRVKVPAAAGGAPVVLEEDVTEPVVEGITGAFPDKYCLTITPTPGAGVPVQSEMIEGKLHPFTYHAQAVQ